MIALRAPVLRTRRLTLRAPRPADALALAAMLADPRVTRYLLVPRGRAAAYLWVDRAREGWADGTGANFTIVHDRTLIGTVGLRIVPRHAHAELGYWLGADHWGDGLAAEAARSVVAWGFKALPLRRIYGQYLGDNHASGRVMEKIGMIREGVRRRHLRRSGTWYDAHQFGILREDIGR